MTEAGDTAVVGSGWEEAGDGHHVGGNSYRFLEFAIVARPELLTEDFKEISYALLNPKQGDRCLRFVHCEE